MKEEESNNMFQKLTNFDANEYSALTISKRRLFDDIRLSQSSTDTTVGVAEGKPLLEVSNIGKCMFDSRLIVLR